MGASPLRKIRLRLMSASSVLTAADRYGASYIPPDALILICKHLTPQDRVAFAAVCHRFRKVVVSDDCWRSLLSPIVADHAEPLHVQAQRIASAPETAPFRRRCDGAAITFYCADKVCRYGMRERACEFQGGERVRIAVTPGNLHVAHLPDGSNANEYWERCSSQSAPGLSVLRLRQVRWLRVVSELRSLPAGDHLVAFNFRISVPIFLMPDFKLVCEIWDRGGRLRENIVFDTSDESIRHQVERIRILQPLFADDSANEPRSSTWTRVEMAVSLEPGDVVVMSVVDTATNLKAGLEIGCCEAILCSEKKRKTEWQMFTTIDGGKTFNYEGSKSDLFLLP